MVEAHHHGELSGIGIDFVFLRDADEARVVARGVRDILLDDLKSVQFGALAGCDHGDILASRRGNRGGRRSRVRRRNGTDAGQGVEELGALRDSVGMAGDLLHVLKLRSARREKHVTDAELNGTDDLEVVLGHQVVDGSHASHCGVLDRQDSIVAHSFLHGREHVVESLEVENRGEVHEAAGSLLGVGTFHAGTCHGSGRRKRRGRCGGSLLYRLGERAFACEFSALASA